MEVLKWCISVPRLKSAKNISIGGLTRTKAVMLASLRRMGRKAFKEEK